MLKHTIIKLQELFYSIWTKTSRSWSDGWLSGKDHSLVFLRTHVWFSAPMSDGSQPPVTLQLQGIRCLLLAFSGTQHICIQTHMHTHAHTLKILKKTVRYLKNFKKVLTGARKLAQWLRDYDHLLQRTLVWFPASTRRLCNDLDKSTVPRGAAKTGSQVPPPEASVGPRRAGPMLILSDVRNW